MDLLDIITSPGIASLVNQLGCRCSAIIAPLSTDCLIDMRPLPMVRRFSSLARHRGLHREWRDHIKGQIGRLALSFSEIRRRRQHGELYDADGTGGHVSSLHGRPLVGAPGKKHCAWYLQRLHDSAYLWRKFTHPKLLICEVKLGCVSPTSLFI